MTANLQILAARMHGIERTIPLLDAIRSVAEFAYRSAERTVRPLQDYATRVESLLGEVATAMDVEQRSTFLSRGAQAGPTALLVVSSERGLCGAFNSVPAAKALELIREGSRGGDGFRVLCWGSRAERVIQSAGQDVLHCATLPSVALPTYRMVEALSLEVLALQERHHFQRIIVLHNAPAGRFQYRLKVQQLFPPQLELAPKPRSRTTFKPAGDVPAIAAYALTEWLLIELYLAATESAMSEQLARIATMKLAADNARKLLKGVSFEYNLAHQRQITDAIMEVVNGYRIATQS